MPDILSPLDMDQQEPVEEVAGLCLSGGGYRAMVFHAGSIYRLNELGILRSLARISSVSGGSMTAAALAAAWPALKWDAQNRATNLDSEFLRRVNNQARDTIDVGAGLSRFNPFSSPAKEAAESYEKHLCDRMTLADLPKPPQAPLFVFNASSLMTGKLVRFRHDYIADYSVGQFTGLPCRVSEAVAASAAFPPFLSPAILETRGGTIKDGSAGPNARGAMRKAWTLTDGGVYDNMGTETVWKRCRTIFVSNAGRPFEVQEDPATDLVFQPVRVIDMVMAQAEALRNRILVHAYRSGARKGALWGLTSGQDDPPSRPAMLTAKEYAAAQAEPTRLKAMDTPTINLLLKAGYAHACERLRSFYGPAQGGVPDIPNGKAPRVWP